MLDQDGLPAFLEAVKKLDAGFSELPGYESGAPGIERLAEVLNATAERLQDNYPYFHPLYAGQMLKPPHPVARLAYALAMSINPNNHALDGGRATSAAAERWPISKPYGWRDNCIRERKFSPANRPTIPTGGSAVFCNCHSKRWRAMRGAGWTHMRWRSGWRGATWGPSSRQWGPRPRAR